MSDAVTDALRQVLDLVATYAVTFNPASAAELTAADNALKQLGAPGLPPHCRALLQLSNGLIWNGIYLYGTTAIARPHRNYTLPAIAEATAAEAKLRLPPGCVVFGRTDDELLVHQPLASGGEIGPYQERERLDGEVYRDAPTLAHMLIRMVRERIPGKG
jgi:hypothetical protein